MGAEQKSAWRVASTQDPKAYPVCNGASGDFFQKFIYEKSAHGAEFFREGFDPKVTQVIFDFVQLVFGE